MLKKWANFYLLWQGQLVSVCGDTVFSAVVSYLILEQTGSAMKMSMITSVGMAARIATGFLAGAVADNRSRKALIVGLDIVRGISVSVLPHEFLFVRRGNPVYPVL